MLAFGPAGLSLTLGWVTVAHLTIRGGRAQDLNQLLGKILRIDINTPTALCPILPRRTIPSSGPLRAPMRFMLMACATHGAGLSTGAGLTNSSPETSDRVIMKK